MRSSRMAGAAGATTIQGIWSGAAPPVPPAITAQPADQTVTEGQTATFSVTATGSSPISYQWQQNFVDIPGATGTSYTTPATTLSVVFTSDSAPVKSLRACSTSRCDVA